MQINENIIRPDWTKPKYPTGKIDLSNNVCYDVVLNEQVSNLIKTLDLPFRQYSDEYPLYVTISKHHSVDMKNLFVGYGIGEIIDRVLRSYSHLKFAIVSPTWQMVEVFCDLHSIPYERISSYDSPSQCNAIYIANPNGISGQCVTKEDLLKILDRYEFVIIDEAYGEFSDVNQSLFNDATNYKNLMVLKTLSKSLSMAGLRIGYGSANFDIVNRIQSIRPSCISQSMSVSLAPFLFELIPSHIFRMIETRKWIEENYDCVHSQANFVLFNTLPDRISDHFYIKEINGLYRMSLINLEIIKDAIRD